MIVTAHQPTYLPWLGLFHKIALSDVFVYLDGVQYSQNSAKQFYNNTKIKGPNGPMKLTVPILTKGKTVMFDTAKIDNGQQWKKKHWKSIELSYQKAKYYSEYAPFFEELFQKEWSTLAELNKAILKQLLVFLDIDVRWVDMTELKPDGKKSDLILDICKKLEATQFIFGSNGKTYADTVAFENAGIGLHFQEYNHPEYTQQFHKQEFAPYMSVLDLLFNEGPKSKEILLSGNITHL